MPTDRWLTLRDRMRIYASDHAPLYDAFQSLIAPILEARTRSGAFESHPHPDSVTGTEARRDAKKRWADARKPNRPGQYVALGGEGPRLHVFRIDPGDDARVDELMSRLAQSRAQMVGSMAIELHPYLQLRQKENR